MQDRYSVVRVVGSSMEPTLHEGDLVIVDMNAPTVARGDIVVFGQVLHRVVWIDPFACVWETGDQGTGLTRVPLGRVDGRVVAVHKNQEFVDVPTGPRGVGFVAAQVGKLCLRLFREKRWRKRRGA